MDPPWPLLSLEVACRRPADILRLYGALDRFVAEEPLFEYARGERSGEVTISGRDERQLVRALLELTQNQDFDIAVGKPTVARREVLGASPHIEHTYSSQAPPRFARLKIAFSRGAAWSGHKVYFAAARELPERFLVDIERGLAAAAADGLVAGCPVIDVSATVEGGAWRDADSTPDAFEAAARGAFEQLRARGAPYVIEPIMEAVVETSWALQPSTVAELKARKGEVTTTQLPDGTCRIVAKAPLSRLLGFEAFLQRQGGDAQLAVLYDGYGHVVPRPGDPDDFAPAAAKRA